MGWKRVKDHYRIEHQIKVSEDGICIGSGFLPELIVISPEGVLTKRYDERGNEDLVRYQSEMDADVDKLKELALAPDVFEKAILVYTYEQGEILEKYCEKLGWPNCTHDGLMMYDNMFFAQRDKAVKKAGEDVRLALKWRTDSVERARVALAEAEADLEVAKRNLASFEERELGKKR